jgi:hypothetical protein
LKENAGDSELSANGAGKDDGLERIDEGNHHEGEPNQDYERVWVTQELEV